MNLSKDTWLIKRATPRSIDGEMQDEIGEIRDGVCYHTDGKTINHGLELIIDQVNRGVAKNKAYNIHCIKLDSRGWNKPEMYKLQEIASTLG